MKNIPTLSGSKIDNACFKEAIRLANKAEEQKNLPVGAVIQLYGKIVSEGKNAIWYPEFNPTRHAEIEALRNVPKGLWEHAQDMILYTTLEPCLMCLGGILLHGIGRIVFGSSDGYGGASTVIGHLPTYFGEQFLKTAWIGPAYPAGCDPLHARLNSLERMRKSQTRSLSHHHQ